ncbi:hypothetical protein GMORB2_0871 [Geosmithia morbida]|uniref:Uncharacterized protein n=1 Tax=Geosmithia morbida TaxID=1094350 RepID=A0A9P5D433_9HYPO|nr:uncharacterized protein GMORB2_0871 [Geosmithia morbida]KAF4125627.1 hypothetical protein GMORB2_0871 [Geosmithia morbida]
MFIPRDDFLEGSSGESGTTQAPGVGTGDDGGSSGSSDTSVSISTGGLVAIIVVVLVVAALGITMGTLFFIAKKREWTMRETLRRSARKVKTALTPRRSEFPSSVKDPELVGASRSHKRIPDDVPPTPKIRPEFLEKKPRTLVDRVKGRM